MSTVLVVVANVFGKQPLQMALVQNDHMIEQIPPATALPALGDSILPRTAERSANRLAAHGSNGRQDFRVEFGISIQDQVFGCGLVGKRLPQLLYHPGDGWVSCDSAVRNPAAVMSDDKEAVEHAEGDRRDGDDGIANRSVARYQSIKIQSKMDNAESSPAREEVDAGQYFRAGMRDLASEWSQSGPSQMGRSQLSSRKRPN